MPAAARSALPEITAGITESKSTVSQWKFLPSFCATARHISTSMPTISCPRRNSYGGNVASVIIFTVSDSFCAHPQITDAARATIASFFTVFSFLMFKIIPKFSFAVRKNATGQSAARLVACREPTNPHPGCASPGASAFGCRRSLAGGDGQEIGQDLGVCGLVGRTEHHALSERARERDLLRAGGEGPCVEPPQ